MSARSGRANVYVVDTKIVEEARALGINLSAVFMEAVAAAVARARVDPGMDAFMSVARAGSIPDCMC